MPIIFHKYHAYNSDVFRNLNKMAFLSTLLYLDFSWGFLAIPKSWVVAEQNSFTDLLIIHSANNYSSRGFESF
jgi:hypothetical protein